MLDTKREAEQALKIAREWQNREGMDLIGLVESWNGQLAVSPSYALSCRQHYADLIAHLVKDEKAGADANLPEMAELEAFGGEEFAKKFNTLFADRVEYSQYAGKVFSLHRDLSAFYEAAAAYGAYKPDAKGNYPDAAAVEAAAENQKRNFPLELTLNVFNHKITPIERYARALSAPAWPEVPKEGWKIPIEIVQECSARTAALITFLYYRCQPERPTEGSWSEFFPIDRAATGIYLGAQNQQKIVTEMIAASMEEAVPDENGQRRESSRRLIFREVSFRQNIRDKRAMAALSTDTIDRFNAANKDDYEGECLKVREDGDLRAVFNTINQYKQKRKGNSEERWLRKRKEFISSKGDVVYESDDDLQSLVNWMRENLQKGFKIEDFRREKPSELKPMQNETIKTMLKLTILTYWAEKGGHDMADEETVSAAELEEMISGKIPKEIIDRIEKARKQVFGKDKERYNMTFDIVSTAEKKADESGSTHDDHDIVYTYRIYRSRIINAYDAFINGDASAALPEGITDDDRDNIAEILKTELRNDLDRMKDQKRFVKLVTFDGKTAVRALKLMLMILWAEGSADDFAANTALLLEIPDADVFERIAAAREKAFSKSTQLRFLIEKAENDIAVLKCTFRQQ